MRSKKFSINIQPRVWHISIGHGFPVVVQGNGSGFDGEYDSLLGVPENVEALAGLALVGDRLIGTNASGGMALLPIPSVPSNTDELTEGPNNLYYTEARAQGVADSAIANHAGEANPHSQYALISSPALTGTPTAPTATATADTTQIATTAMVQAAISAAVTAALQSRELRIGSVYENAIDATNPATLLGYGTWESLGAGRVLIGVDPNDTDFDTAGNTGGAKTVTLTTNETPIHNHSGSTNTAGAHAHTANNNSSHRSSNELAGQGTAAGGSFLDRIMVWIGGNFGTSTAGGHAHTVTTNNVGGGQPHENMPPYQVVYRWVRTA
ncbi:MAG: hypothetical protein AAF773_03735 [Cyanobacteria bacterium P01_D01_bin.115]